MIPQLCADALLAYSATECMIDDSMKAMKSGSQLVDLIPNKALVSVADGSYVLRHNLPMDLWQFNSFWHGEKGALSLELADPLTNPFSLFKSLFKHNGVYYSASREIGLSKVVTDLPFTKLLLGNFLKIGLVGAIFNISMDWFLYGEVNIKSDVLVAGALAIIPELLILI